MIPASSTYLSFEQVSAIKQCGFYILRCATPEQAQEYAQKDPGLVAIRFMDGGILAHGAIPKADLLKATNRPTGGNAA